MPAANTPQDHLPPMEVSDELSAKLSAAGILVAWLVIDPPSVTGKRRHVLDYRPPEHAP